MNVSKKTTFLTLSLVLVFWTSIYILKKQANTDGENFFNTYFRHYFIKSDLLSRVFHLDFDGDYRAVLFSGTGEVVVEVDNFSGFQLTSQDFELAGENFSKVIARPVSFIFSDKLTEAPLNQTPEKLKKTFRNLNLQSSANTLYLLVLKSAEQSDLLGSTLGRDGLILYADSIFEFSNKNQRLFNAYLNGTLLHELGHQLGLDHNQDTGCLMNEYAEENHLAKTRADSVLIDFCESEKAWLEKEKNKFQ